jgi:hypothetical protein
VTFSRALGLLSALHTFRQLIGAGRFDMHLRPAFDVARAENHHGSF